MFTYVLVLKLVLLVIFLGLSAFFSASETALFSLDSIKLKRLSQEGKSTSLIIRLLENPMRCLTTILAGNTLVNIAASATITSILITILGEKGVSISIGVTTLILLMFGEVTPKTIAIHNNERISYFIAAPLYFFERLISPLLFVATSVCDWIISIFRLNLKNEPTLTEEEFKTIIEVGHRHGVVGKSEKEMVVSILELTTTSAQEVMTPRTDIKAISVNWDRSRVVAVAREARHSKLPVYKDSFDNILGVVSVREIFLQESVALADLIKPAMFVPATKRIDELIKDFYKQKRKMAIVVDEYGGTSGLVTLQDVLEEIFGEIYDEFKVRESMVEQVSEKVFRISGKAPVYKVNDDCRIHIPQGDYDTVAGFLLDVSGHIPAEGERIEAVGCVFTIEKVLARRIKSVMLETK
ncbi:MAG: HlyC/CorC family transporter [Candidatus Omnitrophica bacterium]|nr:HlyC/CorC family transporter [Candidatus Omnitrophota bacterium]